MAEVKQVRQGMDTARIVRENYPDIVICCDEFGGFSVTIVDYDPETSYNVDARRKGASFFQN